MSYAPYLVMGLSLLTLAAWAWWKTATRCPNCNSLRHEVVGAQPSEFSHVVYETMWCRRCGCHFQRARR